MEQSNRKKKNLSVDIALNYQKFILENFPGEERYVGNLSEFCARLIMRLDDFLIAERKLNRTSLYQRLFKRFLQVAQLQERQLFFFDKQIAFLQIYYSTINATMLYIKNLEKQIPKIRTGHSTRQFMKTCKDSGIITNAMFQSLNQAIIFRSIVSEHISDGRMTWATMPYKEILEYNQVIEKEEVGFYSGMYALHIRPMCKYEELNNDIKRDLSSLLHVTVPMKGFMGIHPTHITEAYIDLIRSLGKKYKEIK